MLIKRDIFIKSQKYLDQPDILIYIGARQAGKTTILKQVHVLLEQKSQPVFFLNLEDLSYVELLNKSPKNLFKIFSIDLNKKNYIIIDEIQYLKNPSNFLKYLYDEYHDKIKLVVSGSSAFYLDKKFKDSLVGRKKIFNVRTLSFREFLRAKLESDLAEKQLNNLSLSEKDKISFYYHEYLIFGGYPKVVLASLSEKKEHLREIAFSYIKKDIYEAKIKQEEIFYKLFKILAAQIGSLVNASELSSTLGVSKTAIDNYFYVMQKSFHVSFLKPFYKNTRKELTKMPKVYFNDFGLRNFFFDNFNSFEQREDKGALLENAAFRQLAEKYESDEIRFWRTIQKKEIDFVISEKEAFEVKVKAEKIKKTDFKSFFLKYPEIDLSIITIDKKTDQLKKVKIMDIWEI